MKTKTLLVLCLFALLVSCSTSTPQPIFTSKLSIGDPATGALRVVYSATGYYSFAEAANPNSKTPPLDFGEPVCLQSQVDGDCSADAAALHKALSESILVAIETGCWMAHESSGVYSKIEPC